MYTIYYTLHYIPTKKLIWDKSCDFYNFPNGHKIHLLHPKNKNGTPVHKT